MRRHRRAPERKVGRQSIRTAASTGRQSVRAKFLNLRGGSAENTQSNNCPLYVISTDRSTDADRRSIFKREIFWLRFVKFARKIPRDSYHGMISSRAKIKPLIGSSTERDIS